jgi:hypothetical protein
MLEPQNCRTVQFLCSLRKVCSMRLARIILAVLFASGLGSTAANAFMEARSLPQLSVSSDRFVTLAQAQKKKTVKRHNYNTGPNSSLAIFPGMFLLHMVPVTVSGGGNLSAMA